MMNWLFHSSNILADSRATFEAVHLVFCMDISKQAASTSGSKNYCV